MARACPACKATVELESVSHCTSCGASLVGAAATDAPSRGFLAENWLWIVLPIVITAVVVGAFLFLSDPGDGSDGFVYQIK
jgi:hypothetical protein